MNLHKINRSYFMNLKISDDTFSSTKYRSADKNNTILLPILRKTDFTFSFYLEKNQ